MLGRNRPLTRGGNLTAALMKE